MATSNLKLGLNYKMRPATLDDLAAIQAVLNAHTLHVKGVPGPSLERLRGEFASPGFDIQQDVQVIENAEGRIVASATVWNTSSPYIESWITCYVHPDFHEQGLGTALNEWAEARSREIMDKAPADAMLVLGSIYEKHEAEARQLLHNLGFKVTRHFWKMRIVLEPDIDIPQPRWPDGIRITSLAETGDLLALARAVDDMFKDHWGHISYPEDEMLKHWQHWANPEHNPHFDPNLWFIALDGDTIVGVSLCKSQMDENPDYAYVDTLGVSRAYRRQGIALALLHHTFHEMKARNKEAVLLDVDAASLTGATRLYEKAGMHVYREAEFVEKILRDGRDYRTQQITD